MTRRYLGLDRHLTSDLLLGKGRPIQVPVEDVLDAQWHEGALVYGNDGVLYFSDGVEWAPPIEPPIIRRPFGQTPRTDEERLKLTLSDFFSNEVAVTQEGILFEVASDNDFNNILFSRIVDTVDGNHYDILPSDGLVGDQRIFWRGKYLGSGGIESKFSPIISQVYPPEVSTPVPVTEPGVLTATLEVTPYESGFGFQYNRTTWEIYDVNDASGSPVYTTTTTDGETLPTPDVALAGTFYFRARYTGLEIAVNRFVDGNWSELRRYVQPPLATLLIYDTTLSAGTSISIYLNSSDVEIDWGDGTVESFTGTTNASHTYASEGTYNVTISGTAVGFRPGNTGSAGQEKLLSCQAIGFNHGLTTFADMFLGCSNLTFAPAQIPSGIASFNRCFQSCASFNAPIGLWSMGSATDLGHMFRGCSIFDQDLSSWDVSIVTTFQGMFDNAIAFNNNGSPGINNWNTGSAISFFDMFYNADSFNQPIGAWDTGNVTTMQRMFFGADVFDQDIGNWNVGAVNSMTNMFYGAASFNNGGSPSINSWNTSNVTSFSGTFQLADSFNQPIGSWNVSAATNMANMFRDGRDFNQDIGSWDVSTAAATGTGLTTIFYGLTNFNNGGSPSINNWNVSGQTDFNSMFFLASNFNQPLEGWDVSSGTIFARMFRGAVSFNQDIGAWDVSSALDMNNMFRDADLFNNGGSPSIDNWNVALVTRMDNMFYGTSFDQPIGSWNVSNVENMSGMFALQLSPEFNQDISSWDVGNVTSFRSMFSFNGSFNQPIGSWNTSSATDMVAMFRSTAAFDQDLSGWNVSLVEEFDLFLSSNSLSTSNYDALLVAWEAQLVQSNLVAHFGSSTYTTGSAAATARAALIADHGWTITDGGAV